MNRQRRLYFCHVCLHRQKITSLKGTTRTYCKSCLRMEVFTLCQWQERRLYDARFPPGSLPGVSRDRGLPIR